MSIWVSLTMVVREGAYDDLLPFLERRLPDVRGFQGALSVTVYYDQAIRHLLILEEWRSQADHEAYIASIQKNGVMGQLVSFMEGPPEVVYLDRVLI